MLTKITTDAYAALTSGAAIQLRPDNGVLFMRDSDRVDFVQRMTTNDIAALTPGESAVTVLTSSTARNLFVFTVLCRADDLILLPGAGAADGLQKHLRGQIFFMDKVTVENRSADFARLRIMGPQATAALTALDIDLQEAADGAFQEADGVMAVKQEAYDVPGCEVLVPAAQQETILAKLTDAGAVVLDDDAEAYRARRVELGRPRPGYELTDDYTPLEAGLAWTCAENKGCYTGQEIIARQITYDKVTKFLVGLRSAEPLTPGAEIRADGRKAGAVTSIAHSPTLDAPIALAIVRRAHAEPGSEVDVDGTAAQVVELPFVA